MIVFKFLRDQQTATHIVIIILIFDNFNFQVFAISSNRHK